MGSVINITPQSYNEHKTAENWAGEFAKRVTDEHKTAPVLDHPDGSVTEEKLSDNVKEHIEEAFMAARSACGAANDAVELARSAGVDAEAAKIKAQDSFHFAETAKTDVSTAIATATQAENVASNAQLRAISAETKADAAVESASGAMQKAEETQRNLLNHCDDGDIHITAEEKGDIYGLAQLASNLASSAGADAATAQKKAESAYDLASNAFDYADRKIAESKTAIASNSRSDVSFYFPVLYNTEIRTGEIISISFEFGNDVYAEDYTAGLSFDSGDTPTAIDYTDSGILNWVGTDCATSDGLSIFQPSANTHYDIVFYFNGTQFIGLVNGFVPASGNEVV